MPSDSAARGAAQGRAAGTPPEEPEPVHPGNLVRERLSTRGYELGPRQVLPPSAFLRYLEHIRWLSRTRPPSRRVGQGVVRALGIELLQEVGAHVELDLTLWISRVGRTSLDMSQEILRADDGSTVARSRATLVSLDEQRRPTPFHDSARELILDRGAIEIPPPSGSFPEGAYCRDLPVRPSDHDNQDHVNQARYADFVEDVRQACAREGGYGNGAWDAPLRRLSIAFESECRAGDPVVARTWKTSGGSLEFQLDRGPDDIVARARVEL